MPAHTPLALLFSLCLLAPVHAATPLAQPAKRCGWFVNPTPANAWLIDREGEWTISLQGGAQAEGDWPDFKPSQWVKTNGHYGYGCACMTVVANNTSREVSVIKSANAQNRGVCERDRTLKKPVG